MSAPTLDELVKDIPPALLNQQCSNRHLAEVSRKLVNWKLLAPYLDMSGGEVHSIQESAHNYDEQKQELLFKWKEKHSKSATYRALIEAIHSSRNVDLAHFACQLLQKQPYQTREGFCSTVSIIPPALVDYQCKLRYGYKSHKPVMVVEWPPPPEPALKYVKLVLVPKDPVQKGDIRDEDIRASICGNLDDDNVVSVEVDLEQLLTLDPNERKVILFEGAPGSGKSTILWHICQKWQSGELFQQFTLVLLVQLRDPAVHAAQSLADILPHVPSRSRKSSQMRNSIVSAVEDIQGEGVLIMLDGWDEAPARLRQKRSLFHGLIASPSECSIEKAVVVVSSRPSASHDLRAYLSHRVELRGFTKEKREQYVRETLKGNPSDAQKLIEGIEGIEEDEVMDLSHPMNIVILTHFFISSNYTLPSSPCRMTIALMLSYLLRHIQKTQPDGHVVEVLQSLDNLPQPIHDNFRNLCQVAYDGIVNEKYSFASDELKVVSSTGPPQITTLGLLQSVHSLVATGSSTQYHFLHVSFQELCAAYHVFRLPNPEKTHTEALKKFMISTFKPTERTEFLHFESVCDFYSALTRLQNVTVAKQLQRTYNFFDSSREIREEQHDGESFGDSQDEISSSDNECDSDESDNSQKGCEPERNDGYDFWKSYDKNFVATMGKGTSYRFLSFFSFLMESQNADFVDEVVGKEMRMWVNEYTERELAAVVNMASSLESVTCYGFSRRMVNALSNKQHLTKFVVDCIRDCADFKSVLKVLENCPNLKDLKIKVQFSADVADVAAYQLANSLQHTSVEQFTFDAYNSVQDTGVAALASAFGNMSTVRVWCKQVGSQSLERLARIFSQSHSLTCFTISLQQYQGEDQVLFSCLKKAPSLKTVVLCSAGPSLRDTSVGRALLSGDLVELADILGLNTPPIVEKMLDIHIFENSYIKVDFKNRCFISVGLVAWPDKYHYYSSSESKPKEVKNKVGPTEMETLSATLKMVPVKEVNLSTHKIGDKGAIYLEKAVATTMCLEELIVRDCGIGEDGIASLFAGLTDNTTLVRLDASFNSFGDNGAIRLAELINQTLIQDLDIGSCNVGEEGLVAIASALRTNTTLQKLSLYSPTQISQQSEAELTKMLIQNTTLMVLQVNQNHALPLPLSYFNRFRNFKLSQVSTVTLLEDTSATEFYCGVKMSSIIASIGIDCASLLGQALWSGNKDAAADILQLHQPPEGEGNIKLHMSGNTWSVDYRSKCIREEDGGLIRIRSIHSRPESWVQLTELNFEHQILGSVGACLLAELLNQTSLQSLSIAGCGVGEEGIIALASALSMNTTIKHLAFGANQISACGQEAFVQALSKNKTLTSLDIQTKCNSLSNNTMSFVGDEEEFIKKIDMSSVTKIFIDGCTPFGARLEVKLPDKNTRTIAIGGRYWHNAIECQLKPFQVTKIYRKDSPDKVFYHHS